VTRIEQFHPFPFVSVKNNIESYPNLESIVWAQEEHLNAGGWTFVQPRLQTLLKETKFSGMEVTYAGRGPSARYPLLPPAPDSCEGFLGLVLTSSVATGNKYQHKHEEETLLKEALGLHVDDPLRATKGVQ
jgi:2-oxoglutarate dehydrogenase E1 component